MPKGRRSFSKAQISYTFNQLETIPGTHSNIWRKDRNNKLICFSSYGDDKSKYGWNIHHINLDSNVETIEEMFDNLEAVSFATHKLLHSSQDELNKIKAVNYIVSGKWIEKDSDGFSEYPDMIKLPNNIKLKGYERGCNMSINVALEYLIDHIKKGRK